MITKGWFVKGDIDGFFGLFIDNLLQLMLIAVLCPALCGFPTDLIYKKILPAAAISILLGNFFYAYQARKLALETKREDVTALPYGINTPSLLAYIYLIMAPIYQQTGNSTLAWQAGLFACLASGILEGLGVFVGDWVRKHTPRAALLSALAGIAITFISMNFIFQIFANPAIALIPMLLILFFYSSKISLPLKLPGGFVAVAFGVGMAWILKFFGFSFFEPIQESYSLGFFLPTLEFKNLFAFLINGEGWKYFSIIIPMGLFNVIGSLQNLESAEAGGDRFKTKPALIANSAGTLLAALFGSPFPTTIYIGHPGWKAMGARWGYSILNGTVIFILCLVGGITLVLKIIPLEVTLGILLWIGIIMTAQSFQEVPKKHHLAVAIGIIPSLAAWGLLLIETSLNAAGTNLYETIAKFGSSLYIEGVISLNQGFIFTSMIFSALLVFIIEKNFLVAAIWTGLASILSFFGLIHAYDLIPVGIQYRFEFNAAPNFTLAYAIGALVLIFLHYWQRNRT